MFRLDKVIKPWKESASLNDHINLYGFWNEKAFGPGFHVYQYLFKSNRPDIPFARYDDPVVEAAIEQRRQPSANQQCDPHGIANIGRRLQRESQHERAHPAIRHDQR